MELSSSVPSSFKQTISFQQCKKLSLKIQGGAATYTQKVHFREKYVQAVDDEESSLKYSQEKYHHHRFRKQINVFEIEVTRSTEITWPRFPSCAGMLGNWMALLATALVNCDKTPTSSSPLRFPCRHDCNSWNSSTSCTRWRGCYSQIHMKLSCPWR